MSATDPPPAMGDASSVPAAKVLATGNADPSPTASASTQASAEPTPPAPATPTLEVEKTENDSNSSSSSSSSSSDSEDDGPSIPQWTGDVIRFESGVHAVQGCILLGTAHLIFAGVRPSMEDAHVISEAAQSIGVCCIYGIYDGHGGSRVAKIASEKLHEMLLSEPAFLEGKVEEAMRSSYKRLDQLILEKAVPEKWKDGSTAVLILVHDKKLYISNVGDSEAVMGRRRADGSAYESILLTEKHLPTVQSEKSRIEGMGGFVFKGRVFGTLAVSRALGDCSFKNPNFVSAEPYVRTLELTPDDRFLVVACDGLWDKISYAEAVQMVGERRRAGENPKTIADMLTREALRRQSLDNVSAIVVFFQWE